MTTLRRNSRIATKASTAPQLISCGSFILVGGPGSEFARDGEAEAVFLPVDAMEELVVVLNGHAPVDRPVDVAGVEESQLQEARRRLPTTAQRPSKLFLVLLRQEKSGVRWAGGP